MDFNPNDPRIQALIAQIRAQQGGGSMPGAAGMQPQMQAPPPVAGQAAPQMPPGGMPQGGMPPGGMAPPQGAMPPPGGGGMAPGGMAPPGGPGGAPGGMPGGGGGQLDPAMIDQIIALQGQGTQRAGLDRQYKLADALRADSQNQLKTNIIPSSTGGRVIAPSWLNGAVSVAGNLMADKRMRDADAAGAGLDAQRQSAQRGYFDAITGQKKKKPEQQANWTEDTLRGE